MKIDGHLKTKAGYGIPALTMLTGLMACGSAMGQENTLPYADEPGGSGQWPAIVEVRKDLATHTLYRPAVLPVATLPVLIWGNGGCSDNGLAHQNFLREIASHGYVVISLGHVSGVGAAVEMPEDSDATTVAQMDEALLWADRINGQSGDPLSGHLDTGRLAVAGHSCGGLQAISFSANERVDTSMIFNSGVYNQPGGRSRIRVEKSALDDLHSPIAYFTGGPSDVAHPNASDDASRITEVPVFFGWMPVGHGGTFSAPNGGTWAEVAVHWLNWQLKGDSVAGQWYSGSDCGLCQNPEWTVEYPAVP
jgi:dienelactone hydrolase